MRWLEQSECQRSRSPRSRKEQTARSASKRIECTAGRDQPERNATQNDLGKKPEDWSGEWRGPAFVLLPGVTHTLHRPGQAVGMLQRLGYLAPDTAYRGLSKTVVKNGATKSSEKPSK